MRFLSHLSLAVALATAGTLAVTAMPQEAQAAKKKKEEKAPKIEISKEIRPQVAAIQTAMAAEDATPAKPLIEALLAQPLTGDDQFIAGQLAIQLGAKLKDTTLQEKGITASLASGKTSAEQAPSFNFFAGNFAYSAGRFAEAQQKFQVAYDLGYRQNNIGALIAEAYFKQNKFQQGLTALSRAIDAEKAGGAKADQDWYRRGAGIAMNSKIPGASAEWTYKLVEAYPTGENWRAALSVFRDSATPKLTDQENLELMRLMRKADAMASERDYFEYADAAGPRRLPGEVVSVLEEGLANGDVPSSSAYVKETLAQARATLSSDRASLGASERDAKSSGNGKIALATGDAFLGYSDFKKAAEMYRLAISKGGIETARAQMGLGLAHVGQSDWSGAKDAFASVTGNRKNIANFWALWIDQQALGGAPAVAEATPTQS
ncbi:hypothetical protein [Parasphingorhabdus halotolerans]|uniref:Tetratricopeptide repeat protein n=1 Tax=Parasphingorhabdus halotolerans TaxID=2725558 RepID=A0A6H2DHQ6_9SPHN|nr:hypothetical protein [Parasphingorhabdus halotolerans]QJB68202.1 hypothetical protein HF685_01860 [Parasphingorhabdus halotolerans]